MRAGYSAQAPPAAPGQHRPAAHGPGSVLVRPHHLVAEWHMVTLIMKLGFREEEASTLVSISTGNEPGTFPDGRFVLGYELCGTGAGKREVPVALAVDGAILPCINTEIEPHEAASIDAQEEVKIMTDIVTCVRCGQWVHDHPRTGRVCAECKAEDLADEEREEIEFAVALMDALTLVEGRPTAVLAVRTSSRSLTSGATGSSS